MAYSHDHQRTGGGLTAESADALWQKYRIIDRLGNGYIGRDQFDLLLDELRAQSSAGPWQPIESAPKDGTPILLSDVNGEVVTIGTWNKEGTAWVDRMGTFEGPAYRLEKTGVWNSEGGWFQPNEVTRWMPSPAAPKEPK